MVNREKISKNWQEEIDDYNLLKELS